MFAQRANDARANVLATKHRASFLHGNNDVERPFQAKRTNDEWKRKAEREEEEEAGGERFRKKNTLRACERKEYSRGGFSRWCRSSRSGAFSGGKGWGKRGVQRNRESTRLVKDEAAWSRLARSRPSAQQKRDKSSTLIRILPLFALWNTILNGMGAQ